MEEIKYKGEILSFQELLSKHKVEIPIIQRDYAQGRIDKQEIRLNFLNALFDCIDNDSPIKLDFIYGSNGELVFQPLDGQQRLTTLFLLYWYALSISKDDLIEERDLLRNFTYETRITSRDFCIALIENPIKIEILNDSVKDAIIDSNWFFLSWKKDPTIDSMLRTIDDIHKIFRHIDNLWQKLNSEKKLITFHHVVLENIGLTDDLYIKMNARGKLLTPFENFKASFQKFINDNKWESNADFTKCFAFKIDTCWTDYFWTHFRKNNSIDEALMRFIAAIAMTQQVVEKSILKADERTILINFLQENPDSVKPTNFSESSFNYLTHSLDVYQKALLEKYDLELPFPFWRHSVEENILKEIVFEENKYSTAQKNSATYTQKVLFFAQTEYLRRNPEFDKIKFQDWMRVIRNIVSRGDVDKDGNRPDIIRSPQAFDGVVNLIYELASGCSDIYTFLSNNESLKSQFAKDQVEEERNKSKLIINSPELKSLIFEAEDIELLRGRIDVIFYCMDYKFDVNEFDKEQFNKIKSVFQYYFNSESGITNDLRRAFLTIEVNGQYEFYNYWWSYWNIVGAVKRRLFDKYRELEYYMYSEFREYFKKLVLLLVSNNLKAISENFIAPEGFPNWKYRLIKEPELLDSIGKSKYIAIYDDNSACYILKSKRPRDIEGSVLVE